MCFYIDIIDYFLFNLMNIFANEGSIDAAIKLSPCGKNSYGYSHMVNLCLAI